MSMLYNNDRYGRPTQISLYVLGTWAGARLLLCSQHCFLFHIQNGAAAHGCDG